MIAIIAVILAAGIFTAGLIRGWFGTRDTVTVYGADGSTETVSVIADQIVGNTEIERKKVAYSPENGSNLRNGDLLETQKNSSLQISYGKNKISIGENCKVKIQISQKGVLCLDLQQGEIFADIRDGLQLQINEQNLLVEDGVFYANIPQNSAVIYVFENDLTIGKERISAGNSAILLKSQAEISSFVLGELNTFALEKISSIDPDRTLCFSAKDVTALKSARDSQNQEALQAKFLKDSDLTGESVCVITIRCDAILNQSEKLTAGKERFVPADGCILAESKLSFADGETAFDVLQRACEIAEIQLEYSWTPFYNSYYIEGINQLYEFDCGEQSGWTYRVNGWSPNYGCSSYELKDGDVIEWLYTCQNYGADISEEYK